MNLRPQMQLRFRDEAQYARVKALAAQEGESVNNWVLQQAEARYPELKQPTGSALARLLALRGSLSHVTEDVEGWWQNEKREEEAREEARIGALR